jgi:cobyrinic acid a,c-diamide synthase
MIGFVVAGTASSVGKTTTALALMAAFRERGMVVQPFKCGPDFLDTGHHTAICGRASRNLDTWMLDAEANRALFARACQGADVAVVEGMMGLYDGVAGGTEKGSTAEIAKLLGLPVVLVLDAAKSARSIAAVVKGFESFDPELRFAGIVLNGVSSEGHLRMLQDAIRSVTKTPILGRIPRDASLAIPERHLGLRTAKEETTPKQRLAAFARIARDFLDISPLLDCTLSIEDRYRRAIAEVKDTSPRVRYGVASDYAFSFYYADNFDLMREQGIEIVEFSPMHDELLPDDLDGLYLGGGYPELYAGVLSANKKMHAAIRSFAESGRPIYAECGGMMYLGRSLTSLAGREYAMVGLLPLNFTMTSKLVKFGYVEVELAGDCIVGQKGQRVRGHSFHCSRVQANEPFTPAYLAHYSLSQQTEPEGFTSNNILATYIHLHFRGGADIVLSLRDAALRARDTRVSA